MSLGSNKKVSIVTLGCAKNEVDTAHMTARLRDAGYIVHDWDRLSAITQDDHDQVDSQKATDSELHATIPDAIIVNTCSFLQIAIEESLDIIFDIADLPEVVDGRTKLIIAGCMPSRFGVDLEEELTEADVFVPCADEHAIVFTLDRILGIQRTASEISQQSADDPRCSRKCSQPSAYVKISDGCNRFCSFCAIPFIRGRYHSFTYEQIEEEVRTLIAQGVQEIVLIAQDTGVWGCDLMPKRSLAWLISTLAEMFPHTWFRVLYIQPEHLDDDLLHAIASHDNICNYLDIPFQHVSEELLKSMNRKGSLGSFDRLVAKIRSIIPDVALRTTFIVGFPGETDDQFDELCSFVSEADFDYVGIFPFSAEEGTQAAQLPDQIDEETKQERLRTLRELADTVSSSRLKRFIGQTLDVLVLGVEEDGQLVGRSAYQAPDVDGITYLDSGKIGTVVPVSIEDTLYYEMEGTRER